MNVFQRVALRSLQRNRTRTVVTIIGVILSVAMLTAVTTFITSLQNYLITDVSSRSGSWQVKFTQVDAAFVSKTRADRAVKSTAVMQDIGYAQLAGGLNPYKPYLYIAGTDDAAFDMLAIHLAKGRLPENDSEIVIPAHLETDSPQLYEVGNSLVLEVGNRQLDGRILDQDISYNDGESSDVDGEVFTPVGTRSYTIVGICDRPGFEAYWSPGYTALTRLAVPMSGSGSYTVFTTLKHPGDVYEYAKQNVGDYSYAIHTELLRFMGVSGNDNFNAVLYSLGAILIALIMVGSVLLIYNSFAISVSERSQQFGILASVGATKKQLRWSVLFEGLCVGLVGIPLGVLAGLGGIGVTLRLVGGFFQGLTEGSGVLTLSLSLPALLIAAAVGIITILISAYLPARRAANKSAIDSIRQSDDILISAKAVKTSGLIGRLFGLEGTLAQKNFRRNRKRYRSTIVSLVVSVVLFISASAFGMYLQMGTTSTVDNYGFDISFTASQGTYHRDDGELLRLYDRLKNVSAVTGSAYSARLSCSGYLPRAELTERYSEYMNPEARENGDVPVYMSVQLVDDNTYERYVEGLGLSPAEYSVENGKLVAVAKIEGYDTAVQRTVAFDVFKNPAVTMSIAPGYPDKWTGPARAIAFTIVDKSPAILPIVSSGFTAFAPYSAKGLFAAADEDFDGVGMTFLSSDPTKSAAEMAVIIQEAGITAGYTLLNVAAALQQVRNLLMVVDVFTYGFVVLISLIAIANVFNTVSTSINLRRREFAMLRSVGMGERSFDKMMNLECLLYGWKSLLYGLPIAAAVTFLIYQGLYVGVDVSFTLPWGSVAISVGSVFLVVFVSMLYATGKVKKANVIDALRIDGA